ncbi:MAG: hypothetical protein RL701_4217 [Pseudomonadota bacterium]
MHLALFSKSFRKDLERFARLLDSVEQYNADHLPFVLSVPRSDRALFEDRIGRHRVEWLNDEDVLGREVQQSWRVQQLVKLYSARVGFADAWFILDSDNYFVRAFGRSDFVSASGEVAFVATALTHTLDDRWEQVNEYLRVSKLESATSVGVARTVGDVAALRGIGWYERWLDTLRRPSHDERLLRIPRFFGRSGPEVHFMPSPIWTRESLISLEKQLLEPRGLTFEDLIRYSPWESVWVGEWELFRGWPGRFTVPPYLVHIRSDQTILRARAAHIDEAQIATRYLGLQLAARHQELPRLDPS